MKGLLPSTKVAVVSAGSGGSSVSMAHAGEDAGGRVSRRRAAGGARRWGGGGLGALMPWVAVAVLLVASAARGAEPETEERPAITPASLGFKGSVTYKNYSQFHEVLNDKQLFVNQGILELEWGRRLTSWSTINLVGEGLLDDANYARGLHFGVPDDSPFRSILGLKEGVLRLHSDTFEVTLGKQFFTWGTADAFKPTDNFNPYDYLDVLDNSKLGVYSAAARWSDGTTSIQGVVVPVFTPSRLPGTGNRWSPVPPSPIVGVVNPRELPSSQATNMQFGARVKTTLKGWDLSVSYYEGFESAPVIRQSAIPVSPSFALPLFTPVFTRMRIPGFDFSTTFGQFEVHGEGAFKLAVRNGWADRFQLMAGFNYTRDDLGLSWLKQIIFVGEYGREIILENKPESGILRPSGALTLGNFLSSDAFRNALVGRITFRFTEDTQFKLTGVWDISDAPNHYLQLKLVHKLTDALLLETGFDFLAGGRESFWGRWRDNDRFFLMAKYLF
jgi:hypothetical protein